MRRRPVRANHCAALSPKVNGSECWVRLRPTHSVSACSSARPDSAAAVAVSSPSSARTASRASSMRAESSTSWLVSEVCTARTAPIPAVSRALTCARRSASERDHRVGAALGADGDVRRRRSGPRRPLPPPPRPSRPGRGPPPPGPRPRRPRPGGWRRAPPGHRSAPPRRATPTRGSAGRSRRAGAESPASGEVTWRRPRSRGTRSRPRPGAGGPR